MLKFLESSEVPLAWAVQASALITVCWKTVGLDFVPGWNEIWGEPGSQYPRRPVSSPNEAMWQLFYLIMYGGLGTLGQYCGLQLSTDEDEERYEMADATVDTDKSHRRTQAYGLFHTIIGLHNVSWASTGGRSGRLDLSEYNIPGINVIGGLGAALAGYNGVKLLLATKAETTWREVVRRKTLLDATSILTFMSTLAFLPANWFGYRNHFFEQIMWIATFFSTVLHFADFLSEQEGCQGKENKKKT